MKDEGCTRANIRPGLRVAIVLKEDQPTGKRTIGIVQNILTSDSYHHRGIKVRLKDGQVGRVQEILAPAPPPGPPPPRPDPGPRQLVVLAVQRADGALYTRMLKAPTGESLLAIGLDSSGPGDAPRERLLGPLLSQVSGCEGIPRHLVSKEIHVESDRVMLHAYLCSGESVNDTQQSLWSWTGWRTIESLRSLEDPDEILSDESVHLFGMVARLGQQ